MPTDGLIEKHYTVHCAECHRWEPSLVARTAKGAARELRRMGWATRNDLFVCPTCLEDTPDAD